MPEVEFLPHWQGQGPAENCVVNGKALGWLSCTTYGGAMGEERATRGKRRPSGCSIRAATGDTSGGVTWPQLERVLGAHGVDVELHVGRRVCSPEYAADQLHAHRSFGLQGSTGALLGHAEQSTNGPVNHFVHVNHGRGWKKVNGHWRPSHAYVYDSAADGRRMMAQGPQWWPWERVLAFGAALEPNGEGTGDIGPGKLYAGFYDAVLPTDPGLKLRAGAVKTKPYPDRTRVHVTAGSLARVMSAPTYSSTIRRRLPRGALFVAYQRITNGQLFEGSRVWFGNKTNTEWMPAARLSHEGGST